MTVAQAAALHAPCSDLQPEDLPSLMPQAAEPCSNDDQAETCWVCMDSGSDLVRPCKCPRAAHPKCLARWQLQSAGRAEERTCRFCDTVLPDWRPVLTPKHLEPSIPVVSVHYNGVCHRLQVKPGTEGFEQFRQELKTITGMSMLECMQITFQCKSPDTAQELSFKGISAFDAAIHCAAVSAAERVKTRRRRAAASAGGGTSSGSSSDAPSAGSGGAVSSSSSGGSGLSRLACMRGRSATAGGVGEGGTTSEESDGWDTPRSGGGGAGVVERVGRLTKMKDMLKKLFSSPP